MEENILEIIKEFNRSRIINMIDDVESIAKDLNKSLEEIKEIDIKNAAIAIINISRFDDKNIKFIGFNETKRLIDNIDIIIKQLDKYTVDNICRINNINKDNVDDGLENLTKEELIAKLREKK